MGAYVLVGGGGQGAVGGGVWISLVNTLGLFAVCGIRVRENMVRLAADVSCC